MIRASPYITVPYDKVPDSRGDMVGLSICSAYNATAVGTCSEAIGQPE